LTICRVISRVRNDDVSRGDRGLIDGATTRNPDPKFAKQLDDKFARELATYTPGHTAYSEQKTGAAALIAQGVDYITPDAYGVRGVHYLFAYCNAADKKLFAADFARMEAAVAKLDAGAPLSDFTDKEVMAVANGGRFRDLFTEERMAASPEDTMKRIENLPPYLRDQIAPNIASFVSNAEARPPTDRSPA